MKPPVFDYRAPTTLDEAVALLASDPGARPIAGGQSLMPVLNFRLTAPPLLRAAVAHVAHYQIRNRGTVGGSLAHADPAAELPGIAVTCEAEIAVVGAAGARTIPAAEFFTGPLTTVLRPDELVTELRLPSWPAERRWAFREFARRQGDFALAGIALYYD